MLYSESAASRAPSHFRHLMNVSSSCSEITSQYLKSGNVRRTKALYSAILARQLRNNGSPLIVLYSFSYILRTSPRVAGYQLACCCNPIQTKNKESYLPSFPLTLCCTHPIPVDGPSSLLSLLAILLEIRIRTRSLCKQIGM